MSVCRTTHVKATRKEHRCSCGGAISIGEPAVHNTGLWREEGVFYSRHLHPECYEAEIALNEHFDTWGEEYWPLDVVAAYPGDREAIWLTENRPAVAGLLFLEAGQ